MSSNTAVSTVPDTSYSSLCESDCCACNVAANAKSSAGTRNRHFAIVGDINIAEDIFYNETGAASEDSAGHSEKQAVCAVANVNGEGSAPESDCILLCLNGTNGGQGSGHWVISTSYLSE